ncbi:MAG: CBS domain-containing protein [Rhodospirillaceae bacterium]|nr:CBS domain-containing protein [Rhodospirillaceae bacterium]
MYCESIMSAAPTSIHEDAKIRDAIHLMEERHRLVLMVTDHTGHFVGEVSIYQFAKALLPRAVFAQYDANDEEARRETLDDVAERLIPYLDRPIRDFIDHDVPVVRPKTPLTDALLLLRGGTLRIPVVDDPNQTLVGAVSMLTILRAVADLAEAKEKGK